MINDQLQECQSSFSGFKDPFNIKFYLESGELRTVLVIELQNLRDLSYYQLRIDGDFIKDNVDLSFCFQTPQDLFYTLMQLFDEVICDNDGAISFTMKLNASKLKSKVFKLQLKKTELDNYQLLKTKLESLCRTIQS